MGQTVLGQEPPILLLFLATSIHPAGQTAPLWEAPKILSCNKHSVTPVALSSSALAVSFFCLIGQWFACLFFHSLATSERIRTESQQFCKRKDLERQTSTNSGYLWGKVAICSSSQTTQIWMLNKIPIHIC